MVDLRKETHGPGSTKGVNLVVIAYDNRVNKNKETGEISTRYLDVRMHPDDKRAAGQTTLALVTKKDDKSPTGFNNTARYSASQFEAIQKAAGDNAVDLTNTAGDVVGKIYGVKSDLLISNGDVIANTKTLEASEHSVAPNEAGVEIRQQIFDRMAESKAAREAAKAAPAAEAQAAEKPATKTAAKRTSTRKTAVKEPALVGAGAPVASSDEPELG
jgi:hypothetical protein